MAEQATYQCFGGKYGLIPSSKKTEKKRRFLLLEVDSERGEIKQQIEGVVRFVLKHYAFQSLVNSMLLLLSIV